MKNKLNTNLLSYAMIRVLFSTGISCLVMIGSYYVTNNIIFSLTLGVPVSIVLCLYTAVLVARKAKELVDEPLSKVVEYANYLKKASKEIIETANDLTQRADTIQNAADSVAQIKSTSDNTSNSGTSK